MCARMSSLETKDIFVTSTASKALQPGDLVYMASNAALAAINASANANAIATAQEAFHDTFLGVSKDQKLAADTGTGKVCIATRGRYEVACFDEAAASIGTLMGPTYAADANSTTLKNQEVKVVATANLAVGRLTKHKAANAALCEIEITGITEGGPSALA